MIAIDAAESVQACRCKGCKYVAMFPELPALDPPAVDAQEIDLHTVACHWCGPLQDGRAVLVHRGLQTDGASIPRAFWRLIGHPLQVPLLPYAIEHDALYASEMLPRADADARFLANMAISTRHRISWIKRRAIYRAVRIGGGAVWGAHTMESVEAACQYVRLLDEDEYNALRKWRDITVIT